MPVLHLWCCIICIICIINANNTSICSFFISSVGGIPSGLYMLSEMLVWKVLAFQNLWWLMSSWAMTEKKITKLDMLVIWTKTSRLMLNTVAGTGAEYPSGVILLQSLKSLSEVIRTLTSLFSCFWIFSAQPSVFKKVLILGALPSLSQDVSTLDSFGSEW